MSVKGSKLLNSPANDPDHIRGRYPAKNTLVLYGAYPSLAAAEVYLHLRALQQNPQGAFCWIFRHFLTPLDPETASHHAAEAAEAAASQGKFWAMSDLLMERCLKLSPTSFDDAALVEAASAIDLNISRFLREMSEDAHVQSIREDCNSGLLRGVEAAPALFINDQRYRGSLNREALAAQLLT